MADLELQHWSSGNEFKLIATSQRGAHWLTLDQDGRDFNIGDSCYYPSNSQDIITHEIQDAGLVISS